MVRTRVFSQDIDAELKGASMLAHEVPVQQIRVRACQAGQHLHNTTHSLQALLKIPLELPAREWILTHLTVALTPKACLQSEAAGYTEKAEQQYWGLDERT